MKKIIRINYKNGKSEDFPTANFWDLTKRNTIEICDDNTDEWVIKEINMDVVKSVEWVTLKNKQKKVSK